MQNQGAPSPFIMTLILIDIDEPIGGLLYEGICLCLRAF